MTIGAVAAGLRDGPSVVFIHGLGGSHHTWDRVVPLIEPQASVLALNAASGDTIEREADEADELIQGPSVLVGHSKGGLVATAIAERHPRLARRLTLLCPPWAPGSRLSARRPAERALAIPGLGRVIWMAATETQRRHALATAFAPGMQVPDQFIADLRTTGRRNMVASSRAIDTYLVEAPLADRLAALDVPVDLMFGELDQRVAVPLPSLFAPHPTLVSGVGHTPPWEAPELISELIFSAVHGQAESTRELETL